MTKSAKIKAVNRVFSLVKNGVNITDARQTVAEELGLSAGNTIWTWQRNLKMTTPVVNTSITRVNNTVATRRSTSNVGISSMKNDLGTVFTSLVRKDGKYTPKEASAISQVSSNILGLARLELEVHKHAAKTRSKSVRSLDLI